MSALLKTYYDNKIFLKSTEKLKVVKQIKTMPHPGFSTELQPIFMGLFCLCKGTTVFAENIFGNRF